MKIKNRFIHYLLLSIFTASLFATTFSPMVAAKSANSMTPTESAKSWLYYNALSACINNLTLNSVNGDRLSEDNAQAGKWFYGSGSGVQPTIGYFLNGKVSNVSGDRVNCGGDEASWIIDAISLWGYSDGIDALCDTGARRVNNSPCREGDGSFTGVRQGISVFTSHLVLDTFRTNVKNKVYGGNDPSMDGAARYVLARDSFYSGCLGNVAPSPYTGIDFNNPYVYQSVQTIDVTSGELITPVPSYIGTKKHTDSIEYSISPNMNNIGSTCDELIQSMEANRVAYAAYLRANPNSPESTPTADPEADTSAESCSIEGIGWIICPVATFGAKITDWAYAGVEQLLKVQPVSITDTSSSNPIYTIWSSIRNLANIVFIFAFFFIIFSQATSIGIGNYGIKKMLPRLVVAAILVNLSYFICAFAVDLSNIIGAGLDGIIMNAYEASGATSNAVDGLGWSSIVLNMLTVSGGVAGVAAIAGTAGGAAAGGSAVAAAFAAVLPFLVTALFAVITALVVLIARQAIIILLIVISPLAFVAYILPNTEDLFGKWRKLFTSMMVFYPLVAVIFAGSNVAASILRTSTDNELIRLASLGVQFFPLFALPFMLKFSGGLIGKIAGVVNNPNKGPFDRLRKRAENYAGYKRNNAQDRANQYLGNPENYKTGRNGKIRARRGGLYAKRMQTEAVYKSAEERNNESKQGFVNSRLAPGEDGMPQDVKFAAKVAGFNHKQTKEFNAVNEAHKDQRTIKEGLWAMQDKALGYGDNVEGTEDRIAKARAAQDTYTSGKTVGSTTKALGEINLNKVVKVMARGQAVIDEIETKNLKAAQLLQNNLRVNGAGLKAILSQEIGSTVQGMTGESIIVTEAAKAAAGATMLGQGREVNTVMKSVAKLNDKGLRSFLVGQIGANFSNIKSRQVGMIDEGFQQQIINGSLSSDGAFKDALLRATASKVATLNLQGYASQEPDGVKAIAEAIDAGYITGKAAGQLKAFSTEALTVPTIQQFVPQQANDWHKVISGINTDTPSAPTAAPAQNQGNQSQPQAQQNNSNTQNNPQAPNYSAPQPSVPTVEQTNRALRNMFEKFSPEDIRSLGAGGVNITIQNAGGVSNLSSEDLNKVSGALAEAGVRTEDQQRLFEILQAEQKQREAQGNQDTSL